MSRAMVPVCAVTGLTAEARVLKTMSARVVVGGGDSVSLAQAIECALDGGARALVSIGLSGGLKPGLPTGTPVVASSVIASGESLATALPWAEALSRRIPGSFLGAVVGQDGIAGAVEKDALYRPTGALAVDMESHVVARIARRRGLPFAVLRIVADPAERSLPPAAMVAMRADGRINLARVAMSVASRPGQIPALMQTAMDARIALRVLARCARLAGPSLGASDVGELVRDLS